MTEVNKWEHSITLTYEPYNNTELRAMNAISQIMELVEDENEKTRIAKWVKSKYDPVVM